MLLIQSTLMFLLLLNDPLQAKSEEKKCAENWYYISESGYCYYISDNYANFEVARKTCEELSANLVQIHFFKEHPFLQDTLFTFSGRNNCTAMDDCKNFWVGLLYLHGEKDMLNWKWGDGTPAFDENIPYAFLTMQRTQCGTMQLRDTGGRRTAVYLEQNCKKPQRYICKSACPAGYTRPPNSTQCYRVIEDLITWRDALAQCREPPYSGFLAMIRSAQEYNNVKQFLQDFRLKNITCIQPPRLNLKQAVWLSGQRKDPTTCSQPIVWRPTSDIEYPMYYTNWYPGQPDCAFSGERCIAMSEGYDFKWSDETCEYYMCALCQRAAD